MPTPTNLAVLLSTVGLEPKEALVYEALLGLGKTGIGQLLNRVPYKRGNTYVLVYSLIKKGLVAEIEEHGRKVFVVEPPDRLMALVEERQKDTARQQQTLDRALPDLLSRYRLAMNKPGVRYFEGREGIIKIYEELLANNLPIDSIEEKGDLVAYLPDYAPEYVRKRIAKKLFNRVISPDSNSLNKTDPAKFIEARLAPAARFPFRMDIKISGNKVSLITFQKEDAVGVLIDNPEIAANFHILFEFLWGLMPHAATAV
ncbi:MAG: helix-turn-helix domain-containing protein [Patescibacteria group bacterium]|nr:helix-turn-helix domain-containing protein [Patescibacteria group bacterium]MDD5715871.1 helix-turn-helix domain-containing protein [Patescibacteria group bacterium]